MVTLRNPNDCPFDRIVSAALAIKRSGQFLHTGLVYRRNSGDISLIHLGWHNFLKNEAPDPSYFWIPTVLGDLNQLQVAVFLDMLWAKNNDGKIPYSITCGHSLRCFDTQGNRTPMRLGEGHTCASFVLAVFDSLSLPLIIPETWPAGRPGDREWANIILDKLRDPRYPVPKDHIDAQEAAIDNIVRFRPEEVAAAFDRFEGDSLAFEQIREQSEFVLDCF